MVVVGLCIGAAALVGPSLLRKVNTVTTSATRDSGPSLPDGVRREPLSEQPFLFAPATFQTEGLAFTITGNETLGAPRFHFTGLPEAMARGEGEGEGGFAATDGKKLVSLLAKAFALENPPDGFAQRAHRSDGARFHWVVREHTGNSVVAVRFPGTPPLQLYVNLKSPDLAIGEPCAGELRPTTLRCGAPPSVASEATRVRAAALAAWAVPLRDGIPGRLLAAKDPSLVSDAPLFEHEKGADDVGRAYGFPPDALATYLLLPPEADLPAAAQLKAPGTCTLAYLPATRTLAVDGTPMPAVHGFALEQLNAAVHGARAAQWLGPCHVVLEDTTASAAPFVLNLKTGKWRYLFAGAPPMLGKVSDDFRTMVVGGRALPIPPLP